MKKTVFILSMLLVIVVSGCSKKKMERGCGKWYTKVGGKCQEQRSIHYGTYIGEITAVVSSSLVYDSIVGPFTRQISEYDGPFTLDELWKLDFQSWTFFNLNDPYDGTFHVAKVRSSSYGQAANCEGGYGRFTGDSLIYEYAYTTQLFQNGQAWHTEHNRVSFKGKRN